MLILVLVLLQCHPSSSEVNTFYLLAVCNKSAASGFCTGLATWSDNTVSKRETVAEQAYKVSA